MPAMNPADFRSSSEKDLLEYADRILRGQAAEQDHIFRLARALKNKYTRFGAARKLLWLARTAPAGRVLNPDLTSPTQRKLAQQHALCTYKDRDLSVYIRFDRALNILRQEDLRDLTDGEATISAETLGIAGAIYKAQWEAFGQRAFLYQSLTCYERAWRQQGEIAVDDGYTAINAAFILDMLADLEEREARTMGATSEQAQARRDRARNIRSKLVEQLPTLVTAVESAEPPAGATPDKIEEGVDRLYWLYVTMGEALVGLGLDGSRPAQARGYYESARNLDRYPWMIESSARQVTALMRLHRAAKSDPPTAAEVSIVKGLVGDTAPGIESAFIGTVGLALSGGGFRASLYHIGVLARLADLDMLRHIEFLSCVSGGSIIGAYYYLALRNLLETKTDEELRREDYIKLIQDISTRFLAGVKKNIRMLALADYNANLAHNVLSGALPTERVAELYETEILSLAGVALKDGDPGLFLSDLMICPLTTRPDGTKVKLQDFRPNQGNWRRRNKIPTLVLNATTLNTGHNWQFSATWMGEPPSTVNDEIDANARLRRMYYSEAPPRYNRVRLGRAVAASAGVPALFNPIEMPELFDEMVVRLVDGGVHDNQGVASLIDQGCTVMLVSDASGELGSDASPAAGISSVAFRADEIAQERVRLAQYQDLTSRLRSGLLRSLMFIHLKKDLEHEPKDWIGCALPHRATEDAAPAAAAGPMTPYGINPDVQRALAAVRTDLDAFHDVEAWALMTSGYQMTSRYFPPELVSALNAPQYAPANWEFLQVLPEMEKPKPDDHFLGLLRKSNQRFFKSWDALPDLRMIVRGLKIAIGAVVVIAFALLAYWRLSAAAELLVIAGVVWVVWRARTRILAWVVALAARLYVTKRNQRYLDSGRWPPTV